MYNGIIPKGSPNGLASRLDFGWVAGWEVAKGSPNGLASKLNFGWVASWEVAVEVAVEVERVTEVAAVGVAEAAAAGWRMAEEVGINAGGHGEMTGAG